MEIPFLGGAYEGRSKTLNAQRSINLFPVFDQNEAKSVIAMYGTPGTTLFSHTGTTAVVRGLCAMGSYVYAVVGAVVYEITSGGTATSLGSITTSSGYVGMASNGAQILIVDGTTSGYIVTAGTLTAITDTDFGVASTGTGATDCIFYDGYFIISLTGTGAIQVSTLYDGLEWDALDYTIAESSPDNIVGIGPTKQNVWLFGAETCEVYYNSGNADFPFDRVPGAVVDLGCASLASITEIDGVIYWLSNKGTVVRSSGYSYENASMSGMDYQISTYSTISNAIGFDYTLEGRSFYCLNFPSHNKTWAIDTATGYPHEWQTLTGTSVGEYRNKVSAVFGTKQLVGDKSNGRIYTLSMDTYTENSGLIRRSRRTQITSKEKYNTLHHEVEIDFESGVGLDVAVDADGYDPQVNLIFSDDDCNTWSTDRKVSLGKYEEYKTRQRWRRCGQSRNRVYEVVIEEPVKVVILNCYANIEVCNY